MIPLAILDNWKAILCAILIAALAVQTWRIGNLKDDVRAEQTAHNLDIATWKAASEKARADALAAKAATEAAQAKISEEVGNDTQNRLDALRAALRRLRVPSNDPRSPGQGHMPSTSEAAASLDVATDATVLSPGDALACGESYVIATGWQGWWRSIENTGN